MTEMGGEGQGGGGNAERVQIENILRADPNVRAFPPDWRTRPEGVDYLYRIDRVIARTENLEVVQRELETRNIGNSAEDGEFLAGLTRVNITVPEETMPEEGAGEGEGGAGEAGEVWSLPRQIEDIRGSLGNAALSLDHLFYVCKVHSCAAIEPEVPGCSTSPVPAQQTGASGSGIAVRILDTGLVHATAAQLWWMTPGVTGDPDTLVHPDPNHPGQFDITQDGGHGTFTAGCVRVTAPDATVHVVNAAQLLRPKQQSDETEPETDIGAVWESDLAVLLRSHIEQNEFQVLVINFAGTTQGNVEPPSLAQLYADLITHREDDLVILAPAGNEGDARVNWPSNFPWVVSVGGLTDGAPLAQASDSGRYRPGGPLTRAQWSNYGKVDVWAPGDLLVNGYATGNYQPSWSGPPTPPVRHFTGMAVWSGTSFATPLVAGMIAARKAAFPDQSVRAAWTHLKAVAAGQDVPYAGPSLLPGQGLT